MLHEAVRRVHLEGRAGCRIVLLVYQRSSTVQVTARATMLPAFFFLFFVCMRTHVLFVEPTHTSQLLAVDQGPGGLGSMGYRLYTQACGMLEMVEYFR